MSLDFVEIFLYNEALKWYNYPSGVVSSFGGCCSRRGISHIRAESMGISAFNFTVTENASELFFEENNLGAFFERRI